MSSTKDLIAAFYSDVDLNLWMSVEVAKAYLKLLQESKLCTWGTGVLILDPAVWTMLSSTKDDGIIGEYDYAAVRCLTSHLKPVCSMT